MGQSVSGLDHHRPSKAVTPDRLTFSGLVIGTFLAIYLSLFDVCMLYQERIRFAPVYPLLGGLAAISVAIWYLAPGRIGRIMKESWGAILAFAMIAVFALAGAGLPDANLTEGWKYVLLPPVDFLVFFLALPLAVIFASAANWRATCGMAMCALVVSILVDVRSPGTFSFMDTRAAGFGVNPNRGAAIVVLLLIGVLDWTRPKLSLVTCSWFFVAFVGVFMTLSRSGILVLGIVGMLYVRLCVRRNGMGTVVILGGLVFSFGGYALIAADSAQQILPMMEGAGSRASLFSGELDAMETSEDSRVVLIYEFLDMISERPLLGWGTGFTMGAEIGSHNMFLTRWVDNGLPGLVAYALLIYMLYRIGRVHHSSECVTVAVFLIAESFFSHNLLEDRSILLVMAISAGRAVLKAPQPVQALNAVLGTPKMTYPRTVQVAKAS